MITKLKYIFLPLFLCVSINASAQVNLDSLWGVWNDEKQADTTRLKAMSQISQDGYLFTQPDSAFYFAGLQYDFAKEKGLKKHMANALNTQGASSYFQGDYAKAIDYYTQSLKIQEEIGDKKGISACLNNIGLIYKEQGDYAKAIDYYTQSLKIQEEIGDKQGIASSLNNIGGIYHYQGDYVKAMYYSTQSLKIDEEIGNKKGIANSLNNIGGIYHGQGDYAKAIDYYTQSLKIQEEIGDKQGIANSLINIGLIYYGQGDSASNAGNIALSADKYANAIDYYTQSLKIREEIGDKQGIANSLNNIGNIYKDQGDYTKALDYSTRALSIAQEIGAAIGTRDAAHSLWEVNKTLGRYKDALSMYELYIETRDTLESEENQKEVIKQEYKYNYEKQKVADSITNEEAEKVHLANLEAEKAKGAQQQAEIAAQKKQNIFLFIGLGLVAFFGFFMYNRYKITQKQKGIIEEKEKETSLQKGIIEEKHKEITDSINYAERIQRSFLATTELLDENLWVTSSLSHKADVSKSDPNYFVFFKPKDVVSGDFYWASKLNNNNFAFCCADSTGHGVPGAIMSILNISSLEKAIEKETEPHLILNKTRELIIERLKKDGSLEGGKDGMDCSLLVLNQDKTQLTLALANNPVFIIRTNHEPQNPNHELIECKPDKMPVGKHDRDQTPFTLQTVQLQKGDVIYTLTDGMPDQFGGEKGKKYMIKNLKNLFLTVAHLPMVEQHQKLEEVFTNWRGDNEQVDDVCIVGVRI